MKFWGVILWVLGIIMIAWGLLYMVYLAIVMTWLGHGKIVAAAIGVVLLPLIYFSIDDYLDRRAIRKVLNNKEQ